MGFGCVKPSTRAGDNRNGIEAHFKAGGEARAAWMRTVGQVFPCSVALLGGQAQVDTLIINSRMF